MIDYIIRKATDDDLTSIDALMRQYPNELAWVQKSKIKASIDKGYCHVAEEKETGIIAGCVIFNIPTRGKNKGYSVIYDIAVDKDHTRKGIGKHLVISVPCPIRLLVKNDNQSAIDFYHKMNFVRAEKRELLSLFELHVHFFHIQGGNKKIEKLISELGIGFGSRNTDYNLKKETDVVILDFNWKKPEKWDSYLELIKRFSPIYSVVMDYESEDQTEDMLSRLDTLKELGVLYPIVVMKNEELLNNIPEDIIIGLSVPTKYAGYLPSNWSILRNRTIHLLGGSPTKIKKIILPHLKKNDIHVNSYDYNGHEYSARFGNIITPHSTSYFDLQNRFKVQDRFYKLIKISSNNLSKLAQYLLRHNRNKYENFN